MDVVVTELPRAEVAKYKMEGWCQTFVTDARATIGDTVTADGSRVRGVPECTRCCCAILRRMVDHCLMHLDVRARHIPSCATMSTALTR